jgi:hypothetical protein
MQYTILLFSYHRKQFSFYRYWFHNWKYSSVANFCGIFLKFYGTPTLVGNPCSTTLQSFLLINVDKAHHCWCLLYVFFEQITQTEHIGVKLWLFVQVSPSKILKGLRENLVNIYIVNFWSIWNMIYIGLI